MGKLRKMTGGAIDIPGAFRSIERTVVRPIGGALESGLSSITKTIDNVLRDPLPTLMQIGGSMIGIPPYVTAAAITAVKGGDLEDIAKSAAISYATTYVMQGTQFGQDIQNYTSNQLSGDFTDFLIENFNISTDAAVMTANIARQSLNSAVVGGINAAITGKDIGKAITSGLTQGLVYSSTGSFFDEVNKNQNWGLSDKTLNLLKGATSSALNAAISGKGDPAAAVGNYVANAFFNQGKNKLTLELKKSYDNFTATQTGMENAWDEYNAVKNTYDQHVAQYNKLSSDIQSISNTYNSIYDNQYVGFANQLSSISSQYQQQVNLFQSAQNDYNNNKWAYENYDAYLTQNGYVPQFTTMGDYGAYIGTFKELPDGTRVFPPSSDTLLAEANAAVDRANAAAAQADALVNQHNTVSANASQVVDTLKYYETLAANTSSTANSLKQYIEGDLTNAIKSHETKLNEAYDDFVETEQQVTQLADKYNRQLVEIATRDATIDAVNSGLITATRVGDGKYELSNGMVLDRGNFYQDGAQLFGGISDIDRNELAFKDDRGRTVKFDDTGKYLGATDRQIDDVAFWTMGFDRNSTAAKEFIEANQGKTLEDIEADAAKQLEEYRQSIINAGGPELSNYQIRSKIYNASYRLSKQDTSLGLDDVIESAFKQYEPKPKPDVIDQLKDAGLTEDTEKPVSPTSPPPPAGPPVASTRDISDVGFWTLGLDRNSGAAKEFIEDNQGKALEEVQANANKLIEEYRQSIIDAGGPELPNDQIRSKIFEATWDSWNKDSATLSFDDAIERAFKKYQPKPEPDVVDQLEEAGLTEEPVSPPPPPAGPPVATDRQIDDVAFWTMGFDRNSTAAKEFIEANKGKTLEEVQADANEQIEAYRQSIIDAGGPELPNDQIRSRIYGATKGWGGGSPTASLDEVIQKVFPNYGLTLEPEPEPAPSPLDVLGQPINPPAPPAPAPAPAPIVIPGEDDTELVIEPPAPTPPPPQPSPLDVLGEPMVGPAPTPAPPPTSPLDVLGQPIAGPAPAPAPTPAPPQPSPLDVLGQPIVGPAPAPAPIVIPGEDDTELVIEPPVPSPPFVGPRTEEQTQRFNEEFAKYLDYIQAGEPPPPNYGVQDLGITQEDWDSFNQNLLQMLEEGRLPTQWQPNEDGTFTYMSDDGSTLTINPDGSIVGYTEAPVGNLPGETPPGGGGGRPPAPAPRPPAPAPAPQPPAPAPRPPAPAPSPPAPAPAAPGLDVAALLALLSSTGGGQQEQIAAPQQPVYAQTPEFDIVQAFAPTLYAERKKAENPYLSGLTDEV